MKIVKSDKCQKLQISKITILKLTDAKSDRFQKF